jgi:hypothetical protein
LTFRYYAKPKFEFKDDKLILKNSPVPPPEEVLRGEFYKSKFIDLIGILCSGFMGKTGLNEKRAKRITTAILDEMAKTAQDYGAKLVFVYLPIETEITELGKKTLKGEEYLSRYCKDRRARYMSVGPYFLASIQRKDYLKAIGHWDAKEHLIVAEAIRDYLVKNDLLDSTNK